jgi:hypothetical protein
LMLEHIKQSDPFGGGALRRVLNRFGEDHSLAVVAPKSIANSTPLTEPRRRVSGCAEPVHVLYPKTVKHPITPRPVCIRKRQTGGPERALPEVLSQIVNSLSKKER